MIRILLATTAVTALIATPASGAAPGGKGLRQINGYTCGGDPATVVASQGDSAWIDGVHQVVFSYVSSGYQQGQKVGLYDAASLTTCIHTNGNTISSLPVPPR